MTSGELGLLSLAPRCNLLESFYYIKPWQAELIPYFKSFLLDSGAYTFMSGNGKAEFDSYTDKYIEFINKYEIDYFFEMDIDSIIGYDKVIELRKRIEDKTQKKVIPVWHIERGLDNFYETCEQYDYIAIGGMTMGKVRNKINKYIPTLTNIAKNYGTKVHGLGYTDTKLIQRTGFYSVDSTAWLYGNMGGYIYRFDGKKMTKVSTPEGTRLDSKKAALNNFTEFIKWSEYMERY